MPLGFLELVERYCLVLSERRFSFLVLAQVCLPIPFVLLILLSLPAHRHVWPFTLSRWKHSCGLASVLLITLVCAMPSYAAALPPVQLLLNALT